MSIKNTGAITIDFKYNAIQDSPYDHLTRELIWAYETFGYEPKENTYLKKVLDKYLSGKENTNINDKND